MKDMRCMLNKKPTVGSAVVLVGGSSSRMGSNKACLELGGLPMIEIVVGKLGLFFPEIVLAGDLAGEFSYLPVKTTGDIVIKPVKNSLTGVHAGLSAVSGDFSLVTACDMPFLSLGLLEFLSCYPVQGYDAVVPLIGGCHQALHAVYSKGCVAHIARHLGEDLYRIGYFISRINTSFIPQEVVQKHDPTMLSTFNINSQEDYQKALEMVRAEPGLIRF